MELVISSKRQRARLAIKDWVVQKAGWLLEKLRVPALVRQFEFVDPETDQTIYLYTSKLYAVFCIGERRFYFNRLSGKFDGISSTPSHDITGRIELTD